MFQSFVSTGAGGAPMIDRRRFLTHAGVAGGAAALGFASGRRGLDEEVASARKAPPRTRLRASRSDSMGRSRARST
ncbi:twin-arginine translocation signal domain-containing protein [Sorangium sp. So ce1335]|uniref:twin-arginine translocation signal domain-containing protein n=1 Tax=Sorangium sp. So ce1335 TaxID=3133335 RepID=UPI003F63962E